MRPTIQQDILSVLKSTIEALKSNDFVALRELSNHTIHDASIFQEDDPLTIAIVMYALSKVMMRCQDKGSTCPNVLSYFESAYDSLLNNDDNAYRAAVKKIIAAVSERDERMKIHVQEVLMRARIKKGSHMHEHGISIARTAELLGISQWELQSYVGKLSLEQVGDGAKLKERLDLTRGLFK